MSNYERGNRDPDTETLNKLALIYGVTVDHLLGGKTTGATELKEKRPKDLKKTLEQSDVVFDGVPLSEQDKTKLKATLAIVFGDRKPKNKAEEFRR
ncbi:Hypothetical protein LUCI_4641 [Lucifera butyrica]|uniref:HTH cro/C1-type domain-containing protein n=1 Tax=Lucifera butyrica TaxID=1351585 RepID=A0A498RD24_9FIRM|nr:Hypothetical protein LUCI_4641 [Lucifera butyrica]